MPRLVPPVLVSYTEVAYSTIAATLVSASVAWNAGDVIVVIPGNEGANALGTPTGTGLSFTLRANNISVAGTCSALGATAAPTASGSSAISATVGAGSAGMGVWVWRGSDGVGVQGVQATATRTVAVTGTDMHSAVCWSVFDFSAGVTTSVVLTPTPTATQESAQQAGLYTAYSGQLNDQPVSTATSYGTSGGTVTGPSTIIVQEVLGSVQQTIVTAPPIPSRSI